MVSLIDLGRYTHDEEAAETYLRDHGLLVSYTSCPHCGGTRLGRIRRQRYKCYGCRREWGVRKGSIFERSQVPFSTLLLAIKLFELDCRSGKPPVSSVWRTTRHIVCITSFVRRSCAPLRMQPP